MLRRALARWYVRWLPRACRVLGVPAPAAREFLAVLEASTSLYAVKAMPDDAVVHGPLAGEKPRPDRPPLAERARRMIWLVLQLPLARENPSKAHETIRELIVASRSADEARLVAIERAIAAAVAGQLEASILGTRVPSQRTSRPFAAHERVRDLHYPPELSAVTRANEALAAAGQFEASFPGRRTPPSSLRVELDQAASRVVHELVEAVDLNDVEAETRSVLALLRGLGEARSAAASNEIAAEAPGSLSAPLDVLVHVRNQERRLHVRLDEATDLGPLLLGEAEKLRASGQAVPDIDWELLQGPASTRAPGQAVFSPRTDEAWSGDPLAVVAAHAPAARLRGALGALAAGDHPVAQIMRAPLLRVAREVMALEASFRMTWWQGTNAPPVVHRVQAWPKLVADDDPAPIMKAPLLRVAREVRFDEISEVLEAAEAAEYPELALEIVGSVLDSGGTLGWEDCLTIANARARYHRYVDAADGFPSEFYGKLSMGADGGLYTRFSLVQQPLSAECRKRFESEDLAGRVRFLWTLVRYARQVRARIHSVPAREVRQQIVVREAELWQMFQGAEREAVPT